MAKSKKKQNSEADAPELSFEQSLTELQQIVGDLEQGELGLDESMQRFEQGISLLRNCYGVLERAEQRIEILTGTDAAGNPLTEPFDATSTIQQSENAAGRRKKSAKKTKASEPEAAEDEEADPRKRLF